MARVRRLVTTVGRKTPGDGKLEIPAGDAATLVTVRAVSVDGRVSAARVTAMPCGCRPEAHVHHFLASDALRAFRPGVELVLTVDEPGETVDVALAPR